jgi:ABC-type glycerol-3-phosphate transport system permease component
MTPKKIPFSQLKDHWTIYLFVLPSLVLVGLFQYYPALSGAFHSFYRWNGADINEYCGFDNYGNLLGDSTFWASFRVALIIGLWNVVKMIPALAVAVCIHRCKSARVAFLYRIAFVAPMVIPSLVVTLIWRSFFFEATTGYLTQFLRASHLLDLFVWADRTLGFGGIFTAGHNPAWLGDGKLIIFSCIVWGFPWVGSFAVLTHLAKLGGISKSLYEAADMDGVSWWTKFTRVELPLMMGSINILLVFLIIDTIKDAGTILALAGIGGGPGGKATVPALFMLRKAFIDQAMGAACAVGIVLTIVVMVLKKVLDGLGDWPNLPPSRKLFMRLFGVLSALLIYRFLQSPLIAVIIVLISIPWPALLRPFRRKPASSSQRRDDAWNPSSTELAARESMYARRDNPAYQRRQRFKSAGLVILRHGLILFVLALAYLPMYLMLIVSVKTNNQFYEASTTITTPAHWENLRAAWDAVMPALANSIFTTTASTVFTLVLALGAAYFFARVRVPGSAFLWNAILILMMMPTIANLIPLFRLLIDMNLANTLTALIIVGAAGGQIFAIFVLRDFVADIPQDLFEAAEIDGASHLRQMFTIVAPLSGPILGVVGIMHAVGQWNDFILPLIIIRDASRLPVMVQLLRMAGEYIKFWGPLMAGYALASIPVIILFILCMRLFTRGLTEGAVKG